MKGNIFIVIIILSISSLYSQRPIGTTWNHHVHLFSKSLLDELKKEKQGIELFKGSIEQYCDIDTIMSKVKSDKILLISTGYGFSKEENNNRELKDLLQQENDFLFNAYSKYENRIFPFIGIDPTESYSLEEIRRCHTKFDKYGIKLHFHSSKVELLDTVEVKIMKPLFDFARVVNIPLLIHFKNHESDFGKSQIESFFQNYTNKNSPLTIIFAHTGGDGLINEKTKEIVKEILTQNQKYNQNIYFEISSAIWHSYVKQYEISDVEKYELLKEIGFDKIIYGTDYPARAFDSFTAQLKYRLNLTDKELDMIKKNSPLNEYLR